MRELSIVLAALYLRGGPRPIELRRSAWPEVLKALRRCSADLLSASDALRDAGMWAEALVLAEPGLLSWAERKYEKGSVLTPADAEYPCRWVRVLGSGAPPALWKVAEIPPIPLIGIVGSRHIPRAVARFCTEVARTGVELGFGIVSGRAEGCDRAGAKGAGDTLVEIVPYGLDHLRGRAGCVLSVCAPDESFSSAAAMERNALIYAAASHTVVGHARFKEGGTWHGAVHAVRNRLSRLLVRRSEEPGMRALAGLGGAWLDRPSDLYTSLKAAGPQGELFDHAV